jgi:quercetin dioxygenase-like cupin family protein
MRAPIVRRLVIAVAVLALVVPAGIAVATPPVGVVSTVLAKGTMSQRVKVNTSNIKAKFKKPSDFIVQENVIDPGGSTGWHSHPGPALVIVKEGTFTLYDGDDRKCRPHRYGPGQSFVDQGGGHVHIGRNEGTTTLTVLVTFIVPEGAAPRIDVDAPGNCPF